MASARTVRLPNSEFAAKELPELRIDGLDALRVHGAHFPALNFRVVPGHRFSHPGAPTGLIYLGEKLDTCLSEFFGDTLLDRGGISASRWQNTLIARIRSDASLRICDLTDEKCRLRLGADLSALMSADLHVPHAWGLAIQNHPAAVDGIRYLSRFDSRPCLVLFERPWMAGRLEASSLGSLHESAEALHFLIDRSVSLINPSSPHS